MAGNHTGDQTGQSYCRSIPAYTASSFRAIFSSANFSTRSDMLCEKLSKSSLSYLGVTEPLSGTSKIPAAKPACGAIIILFMWGTFSHKYQNKGQEKSVANMAYLF
jgi:hypothetical protein